jgi:hypothetical protein
VSATGDACLNASIMEPIPEACIGEGPSPVVHKECEIAARRGIFNFLQGSTSTASFVMHLRGMSRKKLLRVWGNRFVEGCLYDVAANSLGPFIKPQVVCAFT